MQNMSGIFLITLLLYCSGSVTFGKPTEVTKSDDGKGSMEVSIPGNMNLADYYFSIFGKHLDYDYREPLITFDEQAQNDLSDESEDDTEKSHFREKRFLVPSNYYNRRRQWSLEMRRRRLERRQRRLERRKQWQQNRLNYLNARSDALGKQVTRVQQDLEKQQKKTVVTNTSVISVKTTTANTTTTTESSSTTDNLKAAESNPIPLKQVPLPVKP